jgi:hypothetical protein
MGVSLGVSTWSGCVLTGGGGSALVALRCKAGCSWFRSQLSGGTICAALGSFGIWESTAGCSGAAGGATTAFSLTHVCSPLNLQFKNGATLVWTLT